MNKKKYCPICHSLMGSRYKKRNNTTIEFEWTCLRCGHKMIEEITIKQIYEGDV